MRSQISMWMLTKFAMVFFISALALILFAFVKTESETLCSSQAETVAKSVSQGINSVLNLPAEDYRVIVPLESSLSIGRSDFVRYSVNITNLATGKIAVLGTKVSTGSFSIYVRADAKGCDSGSSSPYENMVVHLIGQDRGIKNIGGTDRTVLQLFPSHPYQKSYYAVIIKCREKYWPPPTASVKTPLKHLFVIDCKKSNVEECDKLDTAYIDKCCGWSGDWSIIRNNALCNGE
ncbi:hypothetical protein HY991_06200 [Candidatus Micrarchaeota archaeon]|nr:hypothetical protein [Candidatus Micrarchaeota archaeon]